MLKQRGLGFHSKVRQGCNGERSGELGIEDLGFGLRETFIHDREGRNQQFDDNRERGIFVNLLASACMANACLRLL